MSRSGGLVGLIAGKKDRALGEGNVENALALRNQYMRNTFAPTATRELEYAPARAMRLAEEAGKVSKLGRKFSDVGFTNEGGARKSLANLADEVLRGPSVAEAQLRDATQRTLAAQRSVAGSGRGNAALALRAAGEQGSSTLADAARSSAILRAQELQGRQALAGNMLSGLRAGDLAMLQAGTPLVQSGLAQDIDVEKMRGTNAANLYGLGRGDQGFLLDLAKANAGFDQPVNSSPDLLGYALQAAGTYAALACDVRAKACIEDGAVHAEELLNVLHPYVYVYSDPEQHGHGQRLGIMAQDLEQSRVGALIVTEDQETGVKVLDLPKLVVALSATVAHLGRKVRQLEEAAKHG